MKKNILVSFLILMLCHQSNGQVLISLLLGDKLNSGKLEFGLDGGVNWSNISNLKERILQLVLIWDSTSTLR